MEVLLNGADLSDLSTKVDIWALGIILYQWVYRDTHPYAALPGGKNTRIKALCALDTPINLDPISGNY